MATLDVQGYLKISITLTASTNLVPNQIRNGNPLLFEGDLQNEESVLEWLIDDDNRELADEIEAVNDRMLERLMDESALLVVFFCKLFLILN